MMEVVETTGAIRRAKLQSNRHQQQTIIQLFTGWMPFLSSNQQCQSTEGKTQEAAWSTESYEMFLRSGVFHWQQINRFWW